MSFLIYFFQSTDVKRPENRTISCLFVGIES